MALSQTLDQYQTLRQALVHTPVSISPRKPGSWNMTVPKTQPVKTLAKGTLHHTPPEGPLSRPLPSIKDSLGASMSIWRKVMSPKSMFQLGSFLRILFPEGQSVGRATGGAGTAMIMPAGAMMAEWTCSHRAGWGI